jgi:hypothetical protein
MGVDIIIDAIYFLDITTQTIRKAKEHCKKMIY